MQTLFQDLRFGGRMLLRKPGFTLIAIMTLALGIGANTAIFSIVDAVLLRSLPYKDPERLALVQETLPKLGWYFGGISAAETLDYVAGNEVFSETAIYTTLTLNLTGAREPQRVQTARVTPSLFPLLGVSPLLGRTFSSDEDRVGQNRVVLLSRGLWRRRFGADPSVVGQTVKLDEEPYTIVGIMPESLQFPHTDSTFAEAVEIWMPLALTDEEKASRANNLQYGLIGRLKPGATIAAAQANMEAVAARIQRDHPQIYKGNVEIAASVIGLQDQVVKNVRPLLTFLLAAVGLVLLIACANVANLMLAQGAARRKEIAIRAAIGAGRWRIVRQLLTESMLLAACSGMVGLLLGVWAIDLIIKFGPDDVPRLIEAGLDWRVFSFTLSTSLLTGALFGLIPAVYGTRLDLTTAIKEAGRGSGAGEGKWLRQFLVMTETAVALVLLVGAGLMINSFVRLLLVPPGFNPEGVVAARTELPAERYPEAARGHAAYRQILERLSALPGVTDVGVASTLPLTGDWQIGFRSEDGGEKAIYTANGSWVSEDYFRAMGIGLRKGRTFTVDDRPETAPAIVINETMARTIWPGQEAIGKRIKWGGWNPKGWLTVVGVVADVKLTTLEAENKPTVFMPIFQIPRLRRDAIFIVRTTADPAALTGAMRQEINAVDPDLPVYNIRTMNQVIADSVAQRRFAMLLLGCFAIAALLLASIGLYGVLSYTVAQRIPEIGIRVALGAQPRDILTLVVGQGMKTVLLGVAIGLAASFGVTRLMTSLLYDVSVYDPLTFISVSVLLVVTALLASYIPARRATKVEPIIALRDQ
jgi:putative ABC transport system permease protein